jgi:predicted GNAT family acetyltransferase
MAELRWVEEPGAIRALDEDGNMRAEAFLEPVDDGRLDVTHTFVAEDLRGTGVSSELMRRVVAAANARGVGLQATCPFARAWLERHPGLVEAE